MYLQRNPGISLRPYGNEFEFYNGHDGYFLAIAEFEFCHIYHVLNRIQQSLK